MSQLSPIERFACEVLRMHRNDGHPGNVDGGWLHDTLIRLGLTHEVRVLEPCDPDNCVCAAVDTFPLDCTRLTPDVLKLMSVYDGETKMEEKPPYPFCSSPEKCIAAHRCTRTVGGEPWCCAD